MAKKRLRSAAGTAEEQLKTGAKRLQTRLLAVERAAGKLATKAKDRLPGSVDVKPDVPAMRERIGKAASRTGRKASVAETDTPSGSSRSSGSSGSDSTFGSDSTSGSTTAGTGSGPDDSWTVAHLRAEARRRGMTGYSRKTKAELLADLRG